MSRTVSDRIMRSGIVVMIAHILFKISGFVQTIIIGHYYNRTQTDAFVLAFEGVLFMIFLIGEESIGPAFLPVFSEEKNRKGEESAWNFARSLLTLQTIILIVLTALLILNNEFIIKTINLFSGKKFICADEKGTFAKNLVLYMAPGLIGLSLGSTTYMILNGFKRFFWAAFGDALIKLTVIAMILLFHSVNPVMALGAGFAVGGFAKLAAHLWGLRDRIRELHPCKPDLSSPAFRKFMVLVAPLVLGILFAKFRDFVNNILILNYPDDDGILTANSWGMKLFKTIGWFVPYGVSIAMFPYFCDMIDRDDRHELGDFMTKASRMLLLFFFPVMAGGAVLSYSMIQIIYGHGKFDVVEWTAAANLVYMFVLPFYSLEYFFMQGFFADRRMIAPTVLGVICSSVAITGSFLSVVVFEVHIHYGPVFAIVSVAGAYVFSRALKTVLFIHFFRKKIPVFPREGIRIFMLRLLFITACVGGAAASVQFLFQKTVPPLLYARRIVMFAGLLASTAAGGGVFVLLSVWLKMEEFRSAVSWTLSKIRRKGKNENPAGS